MSIRPNPAVNFLAISMDGSAGIPDKPLICVVLIDVNILVARVSGQIRPALCPVLWTLDLDHYAQGQRWNERVRMSNGGATIWTILKPARRWSRSTESKARRKLKAGASFHLAQRRPLEAIFSCVNPWAMWERGSIRSERIFIGSLITGLENQRAAQEEDEDSALETSLFVIGTLCNMMFPLLEVQSVARGRQETPFRAGLAKIAFP